MEQEEEARTERVGVGDGLPAGWDGGLYLGLRQYYAELEGGEAAPRLFIKHVVR